MVAWGPLPSQGTTARRNVLVSTSMPHVHALLPQQESREALNSLQILLLLFHEDLFSLIGLVLLLFRGRRRRFLR